MSVLLLKEKDLNKLSLVERKKHAQKLGIIKHLYIAGPKSKLELCSALNFSSPTSTILLNELLSDNLVEKKGRGKSIGGRKPDLYRLKDNAFFVLSIHMEKFKTRMVILNCENKPISSMQTFPIEISKDLKAISSLVEEATAIINAAGIADNLIGIGISLPGLVSAKEGKSHTYLIGEETQFSLREILEKALNKPVYIQNDAKSAALAEQYFGLAHGKKDVLTLSIDWGVGLGIILDGKLQDGTSGFAGEFGHIPIEDEGLLCHCGKRGCLETVASGAAIVRMAKEGIREGQYSMLKSMLGEDIDQIKSHHIIEAARKGDQFAINLFSEIGINLGKGIAILIQLFNPELVIISGKIAGAGEYLTIPILQSLNAYSMAQLREKTTIALSTLGDDVEIMGAVATLMENIFEEQIS